MHLRLPTSIPSDFWIRLVYLLTLHSREGIRAGYVIELLLPQLQQMVLGSEHVSYSTIKLQPIEMVNLASLVAARKAIWRGLPLRLVMLARGGHLDLVQSDHRMEQPSIPQNCALLSLS